MDDLRDVRSCVGEHRGKMRETTRTVAEEDVETKNASIGGEPALNDAAVRQGIDVAAGKEDNYFASDQAGEMTFQHCGQAGSARAFDDALFLLGQA